MLGRALAPITLALLAGAFACLLIARPAMPLPGGFEDNVVTGVRLPTALAFLPPEGPGQSSRMLVTSKTGELWVYKDPALLQTPALDISSMVCSNSERGLLGVAVDPHFGTTGNNYVYLYYTYKKYDRCPQGDPGNRRNPVNRVSRFVMSGDTVVSNSEQVLIDNMPSPNGNHKAGDLHFGNDGNLYVSVGDGGCSGRDKCQYENNASRRRNVLRGKVLRIEPDGDIPKENPYANSGTSGRCNLTGHTVRGHDCKETFAMGFRNPFRMAFDPDTTDTTRFFINDVGGQRWEEIDEAEAGADYGWNLCEGTHDNPYRNGQVNCSGPVYTGPIHEYSHDTGCQSITGGAFVPNGGSWPDSYDDAYLFGDFICHKISMLTPDGGGGFDQTAFATDLGRGGPISMAFDPYDTNTSLYYTTFANNGEVRRIAYTGGC
jgi:glucose/arabinose dehydrogenase